MNIDYTVWAINLIDELINTPPHLRGLLLKEHLTKAHLRGYREGAEKAWIDEQEAHIATEQKH